jgi:hypothetical protein
VPQNLGETRFDSVAYYGSEENLVWLTLKRQILPFIPVFDKSERTDGTWSR